MAAEDPEQTNVRTMFVFSGPCDPGWPVPERNARQPARPWLDFAPACPF